MYVIITLVPFKLCSNLLLLSYTGKRKCDSNQDLLEYFEAEDERFMLQIRALHQDIMTSMNDTLASLLGRLGHMVTVIEAEQRKAA